jgi:methionine-S-sulfoxide reductase
VVRTRVGYTGGTLKDPTYRNLGDHTESVQVELDPTKTSYKELLEVFWKSPNACAASGSRQYRSAVFFHNDEQKRLAESTRDREAARRGQKVPTALEPAGTFWPAEDYHQKYYLRQQGGLLKELQAMYPREEDFRRSTAVARVNGYLGGHGTVEELDREINSFGLSEQGRRLLRELVGRRR